MNTILLQILWMNNFVCGRRKHRVASKRSRTASVSGSNPIANQIKIMQKKAAADSGKLMNEHFSTVTFIHM